ncbi:hypothetical protein AURDEDRAFT_174680 [Auricularia subglabra TFB-10046 SS5]|uniref:DUF6534 domain-containing protein n=1 Tax=Auricularia subglabra (strain TFB-10046 / SS5) TaxID=717982 RepID=J0D950_AURST|nr:hypothetical protein AURDEDRAFT_174680 [Auricularia subglabra TFB-10046 SS5]
MSSLIGNFSAASSASPLDDPVKSFGAWFCGCFAEFALTGALFAMIADYRQRYRKSDRLMHKIFVDICTILSIGKTVQVAAILWHKLVRGFGDYVMAAYSSPWYASIDPLTSELLCLCAQLFFVTRLWRMLGGLRWLLLALVPAMLMAFAGEIALASVITVQIYNLSTVDDLGSFTKTSYVALVGIVVSDIIVTCASSFYLYRARTGFERTDNLISSLLHLTWVTAALPALASLLNLITYVSLSSKGYATFITFELVAPKLYGLSMLYTLNSRQNITGSENSYPLSSNVGRTAMGVNVTTDTVRFTDERDNHHTSVKFATPDQDNFDKSSRDTEIKSPPV